MDIFSGESLIIAYIIFVVIMLVFIIRCVIFGRKDYRALSLKIDTGEKEIKS